MWKPEEELWEILDEADLDLLVTIGDDGYPQVHPLALLAYDEEGSLWFATSRSSRETADIARNPTATAFFILLEDRSYALLFGEAELVDDPVLKKEFWEEEWREHWDGPEDPDYVLVLLRAKKARFYRIEEDELWETEFELDGGPP